MGRDVDGLVALLRLGGHEVRTTGIDQPAPRLDSLPASSCGDVVDTYRALGGLQPTPTLRPGSWDLLVDGILVELDEELHFNRYRALTLHASSYGGLPAFPHRLYGELCASHEARCLKHGCGQQRWMNPSTERHFGPSGLRGDLTGPGASRWKQRALYDLMKDLTQLDPEHPRLARLSIYDELPGEPGTTIEVATHHRPERRAADALSLLLEQRVGHGA